MEEETAANTAAETVTTIAEQQQLQ